LFINNFKYFRHVCTGEPYYRLGSLCAFGAVARGVRKLQFLGHSVRLLVVYERSVYAPRDFVNAAFVSPLWHPHHITQYCFCCYYYDYYYNRFMVIIQDNLR